MQDGDSKTAEELQTGIGISKTIFASFTKDAYIHLLATWFILKKNQAERTLAEKISEMRKHNEDPDCFSKELQRNIIKVFPDA